MATPSTIAQGIQVGIEATRGTLVPANFLLRSIGIEPQIDASIKTFKPRGRKTVSIAALGKEASTADLSGLGDYNELGLLLAGNFCKPTTTRNTPTTGLAYTHVFAPKIQGEDDVITLSVEQGTATRAKRFAYGLVNSLGWDFSRDEFTINGGMLGRRLELGATMTASPTEFAERPILGTELEVYMDPTEGALGTTRLDRFVSGSWSYNDRFGLIYAPIRTQASFVEHIETDPTAELSIRLAADAQGEGLLGTMRTGSDVWLRMEYVGPVIEGTDHYRLRLDANLVITAADNYSDEDGVYAVGWRFSAREFSAELVNTVASYS